MSDASQDAVAAGFGAWGRGGGGRTAGALWAGALRGLAGLGAVLSQQAKPAPPGGAKADAGTRPAPAEAQAPAKSVAVLPFENVGGDVENGSFSDGISGEVLAVLGTVSGLRVMGATRRLASTARTSSRRTLRTHSVCPRGSTDPCSREGARSCG